MGDKSIQIVMPTLNAGKFLVEAIESIRNQTWKEWSLAVVDGGSDDATLAIADHFRHKDPRIRLASYPGAPVVDRVNSVLAKSPADFFAFHHADDVCSPDRLQRQLLRFERDSHVALLGAATHFWLHEKENPAELGYQGIRLYPSGYRNILTRLPFYWCFSLPSVMFSRRIIDAGIFLRSDFKFCADYDWYYRVAKKFKVDNLSAPLISYRHRNDSDGPMNRDQVRLEGIHIRSAIVEAEFPYLTEQEKALLSQLSVEPEPETVTADRLAQISKAFSHIIQHSGDFKMKTAYKETFAQYIQLLRRRRRDNTYERLFKRCWKRVQGLL